MVRYLYNLVMDPNRNPLQALPKMVRFQYMVILAYMWSAVFSIYIGTIALLGPSIAAHTILLIGVFFTADVFRRARAHSLSDDVPGPGRPHCNVRLVSGREPAHDMRAGARA